MNSLFAVCLLSALVYAVEGQTAGDGGQTGNCSAAFYPKTACVNDGTRSNYIQFEECDVQHARVKSAWFDVVPVFVKEPKAVESVDIHLSVQEVVIPKHIKHRGRLTVFYNEDSSASLRGMQMVVPDCADVETPDS